MARQVLENGVILPAEYSDDWYDDMTSNLTKLDDVIGSDSEKLSSADVGAAALSNSYNDLDNLPTIPTVNDATLTIQKNGVDVQTFTANASSNVTANISVPTKTSDLINDSNFVDTSNSAVSSGITSTKVTDYDTHIADTDIHVTTTDKNRWNNQTYVFRYSSTALTASSTNSNALLDNTDNLKVGDKVIDSSGVLFSITAIDTQNSTFTIGTALIDLAQDSDVVHKSGDETIAGIKSFSDNTYIKSLNFTNEVASTSSSSSSIMPIITTITYSDSSPSVQARLNLSVTADGIKSLYPHENGQYSLGLSSRSFSDFYSYHGYFRGQQQGDEFSGNARTNLTLTANRDTLGQSGCVIDTFRENTTQGTGSHILGIGIKENSVRYEGCRFSWMWDNNLNGYSFSFRPTLQGTNQAVEHNLGNSTNKWSTINGLNPSSLGMPDLDNGIDISSYITVVANANKESLYTPPVNGWISVALTRTGGNMAVMLKQGNFASSGHNIAQENGTTTCNAMLPVKGGVQVSINSALADGIDFAYFYPCLGNV